MTTDATGESTSEKKGRGRFGLILLGLLVVGAVVAWQFVPQWARSLRGRELSTTPTAEDGRLDDRYAQSVQRLLTALIPVRGVLVAGDWPSHIWRLPPARFASDATSTAGVETTGERWVVVIPANTDFLQPLYADPRISGRPEKVRRLRLRLVTFDENFEFVSAEDIPLGGRTSIERLELRHDRWSGVPIVEVETSQQGIATRQSLTLLDDRWVLLRLESIDPVRTDRAIVANEYVPESRSFAPAWQPGGDTEAVYRALGSRDPRSRMATLLYLAGNHESRQWRKRGPDAERVATIRRDPRLDNTLTQIEASSEGWLRDAAATLRARLP